MLERRLLKSLERRRQAVILMNALFILYATDSEMHVIVTTDEVFSADAELQAIELVLASFYVVELAMKLLVHRVYFFWNSEMAWNWFDFILVLFSIIENVLIYEIFSSSAEGTSLNLSFLRLVRLCKIVKILRVFRTLRLFSELRLMLDCVVGSLVNVFWCVIMLLFVIYVFALFLQQGVVQYLADPTAQPTKQQADEVLKFYSSVGITVVTLFQSCTSGVDWSEPYKALLPTGDLLPTSFIFYIAFVFISVWNIVAETLRELIYGPERARTLSYRVEKLPT